MKEREREKNMIIIMIFHIFHPRHSAANVAFHFKPQIFQILTANSRREKERENKKKRNEMK